MLRDMSPAIWIHLFAAVSAVTLTVLQLSLRKGSRLHKVTGYSWMGSMAVVAISSFGIREIGGPLGLSWIHGLSLYTLIGLVAALHYARHGQVERHRKNVLYLVAGLLIAGAFTLVPGRRLGDYFWL